MEHSGATIWSTSRIDIDCRWSLRLQQHAWNCTKHRPGPRLQRPACEKTMCCLDRWWFHQTRVLRKVYKLHHISAIATHGDGDTKPGNIILESKFVSFRSWKPVQSREEWQQRSQMPRPPNIETFRSMSHNDGKKWEWFQQGSFEIGTSISIHHICDVHCCEIRWDVVLALALAPSLSICMYIYTYIHRVFGWSRNFSGRFGWIRNPFLIHLDDLGPKHLFLQCFQWVWYVLLEPLFHI